MRDMEIGNILYDALAVAKINCQFEMKSEEGRMVRWIGPPNSLMERTIRVEIKKE